MLKIYKINKNKKIIYFQNSGEMQRWQVVGEHAGGARRGVRLRVQGGDTAGHLAGSAPWVSVPCYIITLVFFFIQELNWKLWKFICFEDRCGAAV